MGSVGLSIGHLCVANMPESTSSKTKRQPQRRKHVPQRTCIACRQTTAKRELVRIVRTLSGNVEVDATGKKAGRGAYLCKVKDCWESALKKSVIEHSLKTSISQEDRLTLVGYAESLPSEADLASTLEQVADQ